MLIGKSSKKATILLVDDSLADQALIARAIKKAKFETQLETVSDGAEAMDYLQHRGRYENCAVHPRPDVVLLDINMPKMDGKQVLKAIHLSPELKSLPVIMLTTSNQELDIKESYQLGANAYITKPTDLAGLIKTVQALEDFWFDLAELPRP